MLPDRWSYRLLAAARKTATPADEIIGKFLLVARRYAERRWSLTERVFAHLDAANAFGYVVHEIRFAELPIIDAVEPTVALRRTASATAALNFCSSNSSSTAPPAARRRIIPVSSSDRGNAPACVVRICLIPMSAAVLTF
jgi:hypothetical protein